MMHLNEIFTRLNLDRNNGLFITKDELWKNETSFPNRVKRLIEKRIEPDAFFCFDNKPMILFFDSPANKKELHKAIWNFNECPIAIIVENGIVEVLNGFNYLKETGLLEKLGGAEKLNDFSYFELVTGKTWEQYQEQLNYKNRVDYHLLENIKSARKLLVEQHQLDAKITNAIIGKSIFVRYLIDRGVKMKFDDRLRKWNNDEFCELLNHPKKVLEFFDYLEDNEKGFNGDLFPLTNSEYKKITKEDYQVLRRLLQGEDIETNQPSLFKFYDFSIIPIEFISNVYELFIGQDNQKKEGAYYTPLFLVDYILKETVEKKINQNDSDVSCKVLDPACGSGVFLVETLRKIIEKYIINSGIEIKSEKFKTAIKNLTKENIYGIDKDLSAIQVAVFSIYLTLLDYLEPPGIETFKFPILFNTNFFEADFFDESLPYNNALKIIDFDFVLGNPPWKGNGMDETGNKYLKNRKKREKGLNKFEIAINNNEIAEGFILRASDFCKKQTQVSFIVRSSILYNLGYNDEYSQFRRYWLEEYFIDKVFELAPVRHEVFEKSNQPAVAPAAVLFYRYANRQITDNNTIEHIALKQSRFFSLFKIFTINRTDYKSIQQKKLKEFDWLWKVLVYGSYLDFNFLKRLKDEYPSIKSIVSNKNKFVEATGLHSRTNPVKTPKNIESIDGIPFLKTDAIKSFHIEYDKTDILEKDKIDIVKDVRIYHHPMLLVREGIDMATLTAKCAISTKDIVFKDSITSIKALEKSNLKVLKNIAATFSTSLFSYYAINMFASIGIERERVKNYNKYSLPYLNINATNSINTIEQANQKIYSEKEQALIDTIKIQELENLVQTELGKINDAVIKKLELNNIETALINYALKINRNLIIGTESERKKIFSALSFEDGSLKAYALIFLKRFKSKLKTSEKNFVIEIWHTSQIIGMFFKMVSTKEYRKPITWISKQNNASFLTFLFKLGEEKITDRLFVQKDIRGFDKSGNDFYIIKPNERRLWHEAIGYLDVNEFADAILKSVNK